MALKLGPPQRFHGSTQQQLLQCYSYLFQLYQQLEGAARLVDSGQTGSKSSLSPASGKATTPSNGELQQLKALILQNATIVRQEMEKLSTELKGSFVAISDFGTYLEEISNQIEADPTAITQYYRFMARLQADLEQVDSSFQDYLLRTEGYIRTGIVDYDGVVPIFGVAVGQGLTVTESDDQQVVSSQHFRSTFTARRLSFWQGDTEVAYLSDKRLYITNITILGTLDLGGKWALSHTGGFTVRWTGD